MPALRNEALWSKLRAALPAGARPRTTSPEVRPAVFKIPKLGTIRIYLWTVTEDRSRPGARPPGEFKIQLIVHDQSRGGRSSLELDHVPTALLGYSPDFGVFVGWEAPLYIDFAYSANVQVREDLLAQARDEGWAVAPPRSSQSAKEVRVAFAPAHLSTFLSSSIEADATGLRGEFREAFFLARTPKIAFHPLPKSSSEIGNFIQKTRRRVMSARFHRDPRFSSDVKREYDYSCAVCRTQLGIVEAAHIVPISEPEGTDAIWNGVALCPNHHKLFDSRLYVIDSDLIVRVDKERLEFLVESDRQSGLQYLTDHDGQTALSPVFWKEDPSLTKRMKRALKIVGKRSGLLFRGTSSIIT